MVYKFLKMNFRNKIDILQQSGYQTFKFRYVVGFVLAVKLKLSNKPKKLRSTRGRRSEKTEKKYVKKQ